MPAAVDIFRVLASCTSLGMLLSPVPSIVTIITSKSTGVSSIVPFVSMFTDCYVSMLYGFLSKHYFPVFSTFATGVGLSIVYICIFYRFSPERTKANRLFCFFGTPLLLITVYAALGFLGVAGLTREKTGLVVGYICSPTTVLLYASPLEKLRQVIALRSAVFIPIHMVIAGAINNAMWIAYSLLAHDWIVFAPVTFSFVVGCIHILLYVAFHPSTHPVTLDEHSEKVSSTSTQDILSIIEEGTAPDSDTSSGVSDPWVFVVSPLSAAG